MYTLGLDFGSTASKGVLLKDGKEIVAKKIVPFGTGTSGPEKVKEELLRAAGGQVSNTVVTGYGRKLKIRKFLNYLVMLKACIFFIRM